MKMFAHYFWDCNNNGRAVNVRTLCYQAPSRFWLYQHKGFKRQQMIVEFKKIKNIQHKKRLLGKLFTRSRYQWLVSFNRFSVLNINGSWKHRFTFIILENGIFAKHRCCNFDHKRYEFTSWGFGQIHTKSSTLITLSFSAAICTKICSRGFFLQIS